MNLPLSFRLVIIGALFLIMFSAVMAVAATNTVPSTHLDEVTIFIGVNDIRPSACTRIYLNDIITGSGTITGTSGNDLILGSPSADTIDGLAGDDCIVGGGGDDQITGGDGNDVCIGNDGNDTFIACEGEIQ